MFFIERHGEIVISDNLRSKRLEHIFTFELFVNWRAFDRARPCGACRSDRETRNGAAEEPNQAANRASTASQIIAAALIPSNRSSSWIPVGEVTLISVRYPPITSRPTNI